MIDLAAALIVYLRPHFTDGTTVGAKVPEPRGKFVLVRRLGGFADKPAMDIANIGIEAWAPTEAQAHDLCQKAWAILHLLNPGFGGTPVMVASTAVYDVSDLSNPQWFPDPDSETPRFQATVAVRYRHHMEVPA